MLHQLSDHFRKPLMWTLSSLFLFLGLVLLPCAVITLYANHLITRKIEDNNIKFVQSVASSMDTAISNAVDQTALLINSNTNDYYTLNNASSLFQRDAVLASWYLSNAIQNLQTDQDFFQEVFLYFQNPDIIFTSRGTYDSDTFFHRSRIFEGYSDGYFNEIMKTSYNLQICPPTSVSGMNIYQQPEPYGVMIPLAVNPTGFSSTEAVMVFLLSQDKLDATIDRLNTAQCSYLYLFDSTSGQILNMPSKTDYGNLLKLAEREYSSPSGELSVHSDDVYKIFWQKSSVSGLIYICVEPRLLISRQLQSFLLLTVFTVLLACLLVALTYRLLSRNLQNTLNSIFHRLDRITVSPGSVNRNVKVDISALKDAVELLCSQYENSQPQLVTAFLTRLILDNLEEEEILSFCSRFQKFKPDDFFCLAVVSVGQEQMQEPDCCSRIANFKAETGKAGYIVHTREGNLFTVFLSAAQQTEILGKTDLLRQSAGQLQACKCAVSPIYQNITLTYRTYHQMLNLLNFHGIRGEKKIFSLEDMMNTADCRLLPDHKKQLRTLFKCSPDAVLPYVIQLLTSFREQNASFYQYRTVIVELLFLLQEIMYERAIPFSSVFSVEEEQLMPLVENIILPEKLYSLCINSFENLLRQITEGESALSQAEKTLLEYIDANLADINLTMLSDLTGMNQNYLSQYFKKHFGVAFLEYVTRKRIEKAKELLVNTSMTCRSIGETVGYYDPNVFIRTFKKSEAITPNEYRRQNRKEKKTGK